MCNLLWRVKGETANPPGWVQLPGSKIAALFLGGRLYQAARRIGSRIWGVRERDIETKPEWQAVAEEILREWRKSLRHQSLDSDFQGNFTVGRYRCFGRTVVSSPDSTEMN